MSLYERCKDMPNPSPGLLKLFKKNPNERIWAFKSNRLAKDIVTLKNLEAMNLKNVSLRIGVPLGLTRHSLQKVKSKSFSGIELRQHMFH